MYVPKMFIYLDGQGIDSLYSQIESRLIKEIETSSEINGMFSLKGKVAILKAISMLLGLGEVSINGEASTGGKRGKKEVASFTTENKLASLISELESVNSNQIFDELDKAAAYAMDKNDKVLFSGLDYFNAPQFGPVGRGVTQVNEDGIISFEIGLPPNGSIDLLLNGYEYRDDYYKIQVRKRVIMMASLEKFTRINSSKKLGLTSHEAVYFRGHKGLKIPLNVFGHVIPYGLNFCQIKPYAIWI